MRKLFLIGYTCLFVGHLSAAGIPAQITYQGTLKQKGVPANGQTNMLFRLTNADGTLVYWSSGNQVIPVTQGLFSTSLTPTGVDWQNVTPYVEVSVEGQLLGPREPVNATVYATMAGSVIDGAINRAQLADGSVGPTKLADASVTTAKIGDGVVTWQKIDPATIPPSGPGLVPSGAILMFASLPCPSGWTEYTTLAGRVPFGRDPGNAAQFSLGYSGGNLVHTHTFTTSNDGVHNHDIPFFANGDFSNYGWTHPTDGPSFGYDSYGPANVVTSSQDGAAQSYIAAHVMATNSNGSHHHTGTTDSSGSLPPYGTVVWCQKN